MNLRECLLLVAGCIPAIGVSSAAEVQSASHQADSSQWAQFHGPMTHGFHPTGVLPHEWAEDDYQWRANLGSRDVGSPVIAGGRVFLMVSKPEQQQIALEAFDLESGERRFSRSFPQSAHHLHGRNTFASSTPAADGQHVFVAWSDPDHTMLMCFDHDGNEIWSRDFGTWQSQHGFGSSPRLFGSMVILFNSQQAEQLKVGEKAGQSRMIAVDRATGQTIWETPLNTTRTCYGVPAIFQHNGQSQIVDANTGNGMFGIDAKTGSLLWSLPVFHMRCCSSPLVVGDIAIASAGSGGGGNHLVAVRIPKSAAEKPEEIYRMDRGAPYVPTSAIKQTSMYMIDDKGIASCVDIETGKMLWSKRIGGNFGASPIIVGDKLLLISLDGKATILRASETFEQLGTLDLGGPVGATPAFSDGRLLLRVDNELRCLKPQT